MKNQLDFSTDALDQLNRLIAAASDPDDVERVADQLELCLRWYDPRNDPDHTMNCGSVAEPGLLPAPHYSALMIAVAPLRYYFMVDDSVRPFIMKVVRVEWMLAVADPGAP
jgi:hypothetical protein